MRKTIYKTIGNGDKHRAFKLYDQIRELYQKQYKKNPPDMFVGIQAKLIAGSENNWVLTVDGTNEEIGRVESLVANTKL